MVLGKNIRYLRKQKDMSQDRLAELLGYKSFTTIQKWESGVAEPPFKTLVKIADLFRVDVDTLASDDLSIDNSVDTTPLQKQLLLLMEQLNEDGQRRVIEYAADLVASGRYAANVEDDSKLNLPKSV